MSRNTSVKNPCPICKNTHGCRTVEDEITKQITRVLCLRTLAQDYTPGYRFIKLLADGMGGLLVMDNGEQQSDRTSQNEIEWQIQKRKQEKSREAYLNQLLSPKERNINYRKILQELTLNESHVLELRRRGLNDSAIERIGFKSWHPGRRIADVDPRTPGIDVRGDRLVGSNGIFIPAYNPSQMIMGAQIKTNSGSPKYVWLSSHNRDYRPNGVGPQLNSGEMPLFVSRPRRRTSHKIGLCEGALKAAIAAEMSGQIFIGASTGWFGIETLRSYLEQLAFELGHREVILYPDAGAVVNTGSIPQANQNAIRLAKSWGFGVEVAWWGQLSKEQDLDIDDLLVAGRADEIDLITADAFFQKHPIKLREKLDPDQPQRAGTRLLNRPIRTKHATFSPNIPTDYDQGDRLSAWYNLVQPDCRTVILDSSDMGTGKSYNAGQVTPMMLGASQVIYISNDHRNVTTPTLRDWPDLQGRHGGLTEVVGPGGVKQQRRAKKDETEISTPSNCDRHLLADLLPSRNVPATGEFICVGCPFLKDCRSGVGDFTYLHDRQQVMKAECFRAHIESLDVNSLKENTVLIVDEAGRLPLSRSFMVTAADIDRTILDLEAANIERSSELSQFLRELRRLVKEKLPLYGYAHESVLEHLPALPDLSNDEIERISYQGLEFLLTAADGETRLSDLPPEVRWRFKQDTQKLTQEANSVIALRWLPEFFRAAKGYGRLRLTNAGMTVTIRNDRVVELLKHPKIKALILLDASESPEIFEKWLGESVTHIRQKPPHVLKSAHVKIVQFGDMGLLGMSRGKEQQRRVRETIASIKEIHPDAMVIDSRAFAKTGEGYWYRDSRGSNVFQHASALILVGPPIPNISACSDEFALIFGRHPSNQTRLNSYPINASNAEENGPWWVRTLMETNDPELSSFIRHRTLAEIDQAIGRLRASRRPGQELTVYFLSDYPLDRPVEFMKVSDFAPGARDRREATSERIKAAIKQLEAEDKDLTQEAIAALAGLTQGEISKTLTEVEDDWLSHIPSLIDPLTIRNNLRPLNNSELATLVAMLDVVQTSQEMKQFESLTPFQKNQLWGATSTPVKQRIRSLQFAKG